MSKFSKYSNKTMVWANLKNNKCPKCGKEFDDFTSTECLRCDCGFLISWRRFKEIVQDMTAIKSKIHLESNEEELNNL